MFGGDTHNSTHTPRPIWAHAVSSFPLFYRNSVLLLTTAKPFTCALIPILFGSSVTSEYKVSLFVLYHQVFSLNWIISIGIWIHEIYLTLRKKPKPKNKETNLTPSPPNTLCSMSPFCQYSMLFRCQVVDIDEFSILPASNSSLTHSNLHFTEIGLVTVKMTFIFLNSVVNSWSSSHFEIADCGFLLENVFSLSLKHHSGLFFSWSH